MKKIDYKVSGGKLLRLKVDIEKDIIKNIKINGDFFVYPEKAIFEIENFLIGHPVNEVNKALDNFIKNKKITVIGFSPSDIENILKESIS